MVEPTTAIMRNSFKHKDIILSKISILLEFLEFLKVRKKWWLLPIIFFLALFGWLIVVTQGSVVAPFIYTIF